MHLTRSTQLRHYLLSGAFGLLALGTPIALFADYEDGVDAAFNGDFDTAFREFTASAESGLDLAQYNLGILYFTGQGVGQDYDQAFKWTLAAAEQGHIAAQFNLGFLYFEGQGTDIDFGETISWYSKAARAGHADAAMELATIYQQGISVGVDPVTAHAWASMAINNKHPDAKSLRDDIEDEMNPDQLSQARRLFARWQIEL